ncbi:MAG: spermine synthase [Chloroflexi bacterium]|nr:fused MFS/spermidine synthase [Chloroflexota bacterium]MQC27063.1 spermine synthase [Chloroflexota bacterium]
MPSHRYLTFAVFAAGLTTLAVELSASRLLGAVFGTSNLVWASIIGLILIYLTAGYFIGGRWADRSPHPETFYRILLWAAFSIGLAALIARPVLRAAANAFDQLEVGLLLGAFVSVLVLFIIPITLLGTLSPFAIRLNISDPQHAGQVAGRIYAISTLGSFVGTFLPDLVLIPRVGTTYTFLILSGFLMLVALVGLARVQSARAALRFMWMPLLLAALALLWARGAFKTTAGQIYETESAYNYIQVIELNGAHYLRLNEGQGIHSAYHPDQIAFNGPWLQFLAAPFFNPDFDPEQIDSIAIIGLAAGTSARQATALLGPVPIDGYELDPAIIRVGRDYFAMTMPNLEAIPQDGRWGLAHSEQRYSLIEIDAYRPPYIPWHLTTLEFFELTRAHLADDGALAINVGRAPGDRRLIDALVVTLSEVFPSVHVMDVPDTFNSLVYATVQPSSFADLQANRDRLAAGGADPLLLTALDRTLANHQPTPTTGVLLTDERAPVESIVNSMVLNYVLSGDYEELQ